MATLQNYISLRDGVSPMLEKMSRAAHTVSNKLNIASGSAGTPEILSVMLLKKRGCLRASLPATLSGMSSCAGWIVLQVLFQEL